MNEKKLQVAKPVLVAATLTAIVWVGAGSLTPPAGPIAPTMKTLTEVEPRIAVNATNTPGDADSLFKITQPGSYYLTGNITGVSGEMGIEIAASGVTVDLMGFDLVGVPGSLDAIRVSVGANNIGVVSGSVRNWAQDGVDLASTTNTRLADLLVAGNTGHGIVAGSYSVITRCAAYFNENDGIGTGSGSEIINCLAHNNTGSGLRVNDRSTITDCTVSSNTSNGITTDIGCTISNCTTYGNTGNGIRTSSSCTITNCTAYSNTGDGINFNQYCIVRNNTCAVNGVLSGDGAGIHATFSDNRIEGNNCTNNDRGMDVDVAGNFIARNTCSGNTTNWDVAAGNVCLVVSAATSAAILGDTGGVAPGSTDPNANFTY